jgi:hypothetical protein
MPTRQSNPYISKDIVTIIDAFCDPTTPSEFVPGQEYVDPGTPTPGERGRQAITGFPGWLKNQGGENSVAALSNKLQDKMDQAQGWVESLYSYGTYGSPGTTFDTEEIDLGPFGSIPSVQGIEMRNTWYTMSQADNAGDKIKALIADCIPCKDRILALLSLNPIEDVWRHFERMYKQFTFFLVDLYDLFLGDHSVGVFADLCNLLNFLSFMCIPDLAGIIIVLSKLLAKYAIKFKDIEISFMSILGRFSGPALSPLLATVDKYIQLIFGPIECVIAAIDAQLQKADVTQAWKRNMQGKKDTDRTFSIQEFSGTLKGLRKKLQTSVDEARKEWRKLDESMKDLLGVTDEMDKQLLDISFHMDQTVKFIGLVQAVIIALTGDAIKCGPSGTGEEELQNFLSNYVAPNFDVDITVQDGEARLSPRVPDGIDDLLGTIGKYQKQADISLPTTAQAKAPAQVGQVIIPLKNCLYTTTDGELEKVKEFLGDFQQS